MRNASAPATQNAHVKSGVDVVVGSSAEASDGSSVADSLGSGVGVGFGVGIGVCVACGGGGGAWDWAPAGPAKSVKISPVAMVALGFMPVQTRACLP